MSQRCSPREKTIAKASAPPSRVPMTRPSRISDSVVSVLQKSSGACATKARATEAGSGSMKAGTPVKRVMHHQANTNPARVTRGRRIG
jgi:hypothetical protein